MNQSHFSRMMRQHGINDFLSIWQATFEAGNPYQRQRAFDDEVEEEFWRGHSQKYDSIPSLYDYAPEVFQQLLAIIGKKKKLIEFGAGTGKFTLPMAKHSQKIIAVDFSQEMLNILNGKLMENQIDNVELLKAKFENAILPKVDAIYAINANYRIFDMEKALLKMKSLAAEKVCLVWTMQRSIYDSLLNQTAVKGIGRKQEYIHLINLLYQMGIDGNLKMMKVNKAIFIEDLAEHIQAISELAKEYQLNEKELLDRFEKKIEKRGSDNYYICPLTVAFIYFDSGD